VGSENFAIFGNISLIVGNGTRQAPGHCGTFIGSYRYSIDAFRSRVTWKAGWDGPGFSADTYIRGVWPTVIKFGMATHVGGACFNGSAVRSALQGVGPHRAPNFWYPLIVPTPSDVERRNSACNTHWREPCVRGQLRPSQGDMDLSTHIYTVWPPAAEDVMSAHVREGHVFMGLEVISHAIACCTNASRGLTAMAEFRSKQQWVKINFVLVLGCLMFVLSLWLSPW